MKIVTKCNHEIEIEHIGNIDIINIPDCVTNIGRLKLDTLNKVVVIGGKNLATTNELFFGCKIR